MARVKASKQHRMVVVRHRPVLTWGLRALITAGFGIGAWYAHDYGYQTGAAKQATLEAELAQLSREARHLKSENTELTQAITNTKIGAEVDRKANEAVRQELLAIKASLQKAQEENRFYKNIMSPEKGKKGPDLGNWELSSNDGEYYFKLVAKQLAKHTSWVKGDVTLALEGTLNGETTALDYSDISTAEDAKLRVKFRYFQTLTGSFTLPEGFEPAQIVATLTTQEKKPKTITKQFQW